MNYQIIPATPGASIKSREVIAWAIREATSEETLEGYPDKFVVEPVFAPKNAYLPYTV